MAKKHSKTSFDDLFSLIYNCVQCVDNILLKRHTNKARISTNKTLVTVLTC